MGKYKVLYKNLRYAETCKRNVLLHFEGQEQVIYKSMKEISALLETQRLFAKCHASFYREYGVCKKRGESRGGTRYRGEDPDQPAETQSVYSKIGRLLGDML